MTDLPILRTEVYPGALDGDDRDPSNPDSTDIWFEDYTRYPNAMGSQPGPIYEPGPAALTDGSDDTFIRISSAWAADWFVILDGTGLAEVQEFTVTLRYRVIYLDPTDPAQYWDASVELMEFTSQGSYGMHAFITTEQRLDPGSDVQVVSFTYNQAWVDDSNSDPETLNGSWPGTTVEEARDGLLMGNNNEVLLLLSAQGGALPYEVNVLGVSVTVAGSPYRRTSHRDDSLAGGPGRNYPPSKALQSGKRTSGGYP